MRTIILFVDREKGIFTKHLREAGGRVTQNGAEFCGAWKIEELEKMVEAYKKAGDIVKIVD